MNTSHPLVGIIMGSASDAPVMEAAAAVLRRFSVPYEMTVVSAHRSPEWMVEYAKGAESRGLQAIIAGAGGAAHLPGMVASLTVLPVIGVPVRSSNSLDGWDSLLSIVQMPSDVPVATVSVNGAHNAGVLAVQILATADPGLRAALHGLKEELREKVKQQGESLAQQLGPA